MQTSSKSSQHPGFWPAKCRHFFAPFPSHISLESRFPPWGLWGWRCVGAASPGIMAGFSDPFENPGNFVKSMVIVIVNMLISYMVMILFCEIYGYSDS